LGLVCRKRKRRINKRSIIVSADKKSTNDVNDADGDEGDVENEGEDDRNGESDYECNVH
ncbi:hypothetical protein HELRODRAFT_189595, partial [Helobdella robusta]|uniref:Uncharacterized protein n=1 Tax=Helobdella robusta TaxID=6412 RepID=T1FR67_HELRO